ncbi:MAG TPA: murein biosynthesis integral membrane protein MurJ, partial [Thermosulfidibacter takaii]|nr:murein biosynthesis integral membrane protein MurJ [Thermosulfidibacter takaii]
MAQDHKKGVAGATLIISSFTLMSRILGFARDILIASFLGTSNVADAFFVAFRIPNLFRRLLGEGALSAAFIPVFTQYYLKNSRDEAQEFLNSAFSFFLLTLTLLLILGELFTPWLVKATAPGFFRLPEKMALTVALTRITFPYIFFMGLAILTMALLNALKHFAIPAFSPVLLNAPMITAIFIGHKTGNVAHALAWGVLVGGVTQLGLQVATVFKKGWKLKPTLHVLHPGVLETATLMLPSAMGLTVNHLNAFVDTILASLLPPGSVSYLYYANRLVQFPLGLFGIALGTALLPTLSQHQTLEDREAFRETFTFGL